MLGDCRDSVRRRFFLVQDNVLLPVGQDLLDGVVAVVPENESQSAGLYEPFLSDPLPQGEYALAGLVRLLRIPSRLDDPREEILHRFPDGSRLVQEGSGIPLEVVLLGLGQMVRIRRVPVRLGAQGMLRDTLVFVVDIDIPAIIMDVHFLPDQLHRDAVIVFFQAHVSVLLDRCDSPLLDFEPDRVQRPHAGPFDLFILLAPAVVPAGQVRIVVNFQGDPDSGVKAFQVVVFLLFNQGVDGPVDEFDGSFYEGLISRPADAGRQRRTAVMLSEGGEVLVELGFVFVRMRHGRLQVIRHDYLRRPAVEIEGVLAGVDEILLLLAHHRFHISEL